ncbi:MAG TPA: IS1595 family transposase [Candidatus Bathyarchaeia archaeon]|jgi:transposase-like protein|nr:IS1595 family transposase [Candidatus Bathyarchaeia archaeon]
MANTTLQARPQAGKDYPKNYADFLSWFPDDTACLDYLDWLRWPSGFSCPECSGGTGWRMKDGRWWCKACRHRVSATAGTIFHHTKTPLTVWFAAAWHMTAPKNGVSAKTLHRLLGFGSYETAWAMLHRFRGAIGHAEHTRLSGDVEVDETIIGGVHPGKRGRGAAGKVLVAVAVEQIQPKGFGRCRIQVIPNAEANTLRSFLLTHVEPGSTVLTDGLASYPLAAGDDYIHRSTSIKGSGMDAHEALPGVHRVASLVKRWLLGTHQGSFSADHIQAYLDEFSFRFNRRGSRARGMLFYRLLEQSVAMHPISFRNLVANPRPRTVVEDSPMPPSTGKSAPLSLHMEVSPSPWRR